LEEGDAGLPLGKIVCLDDFTGEDAILIPEGLPVVNFRSAAFLQQVTDERGLLTMTDAIRDFQILIHDSTKPTPAPITYNCRCDGEMIRTVPVLENNDAVRERAKTNASSLRVDKGRYCFTMTISKLAELLESKGCQISFPTLDYIKPRESNTSSAEIRESSAPLFAVGRFLSVLDSGEDIKVVLRNHSTPMTGRKEDLLEKLAQLAARMYKKAEPTLDAYFCCNHFIHVAAASRNDATQFPVLEHHDLRNLLLTMYVLSHLRGNTILEATHHNNTYSLLDLARALIKREVFLTGTFLRVE